MLSSIRLRRGCGFRLSRLPVAKLSIATTSSPRASKRSMTVEPTSPDPPVTNTFIPGPPLLFCSQSLRRPGDQHWLRGWRLGQHAPVMSGTVVEDLVPQFQAQEPPNLAREAAGAVEIGEHGVGVHKRALPGIA